MLEVGQIVEASVTQVRQFGLFVEVDGVPGLILIPELSWTRVRHPKDIAGVGDTIPCRILALHDPPRPNSHFAGSLKQCHPERDPWRDPGFYVPGQSFVSTIERVRDWGYWMTHPERETEVLLKREAAGGAPLPFVLEVGDTVEVRIAEVDVERRTVVVDFVARIPKT